jgi:hypothetical protein
MYFIAFHFFFHIFNLLHAPAIVLHYDVATTVLWGCAPLASPRSWRPPRAPLRASTAASPPPRTTSPTPSLVNAVLNPALAPACVRKCARVSLHFTLPWGPRACAHLRACSSGSIRRRREPTRADVSQPQPQHSRAAWLEIRGVAQSGAFLSLSCTTYALLLHRVSCCLTRAPSLVHAPHRPLRRLRQRAVDLPRCIRRLHGPTR